MDDLKRKVGSDTFSIEHKGVNPFDADMTAWVIVSGNDAAGSVHLSNNEVDRRWSIVQGGRALRFYLAEKLGTETVAGEAWLQAEGQNILSDAQEAGRWLRTLIERHGDVTTVKPLHGEDFQTLRDVQRSLEDRICSAVFQRDDDDADGEPSRFEAIKTATLYDFYVYSCQADNRRPKARGTFYVEVMKWADRHSIELRKDRLKVGRGRSAASFEFFVSVENEPRYSEGSDTRLAYDYDDHFFDDAGGKRKWLIHID